MVFPFEQQDFVSPQGLKNNCKHCFCGNFNVLNTNLNIFTFKKRGDHILKNHPVYMVHNICNICLYVVCVYFIHVIHCREVMNDLTTWD